MSKPAEIADNMARRAIDDKFVVLFSGKYLPIHTAIRELKDIETTPGIFGYATRLSWRADFSDASYLTGQELNLAQAISSIIGVLQLQSVRQADENFTVALSVLKTEVANAF